MQPLHHSRSQEANWTLQRPDLSSPRPSARRWCSGEQSGSYLAVLPQNWDTSSGYTWIWRFRIHQEFCVVIHKGCSTDHNNFSAPTHLQTYLLYHKKDDNGRILGPFTNYFWEFAEKLQEFCEDNVAMRQLCRKHEKLQMPRWWKSWVLPLNFRNPPIGLDLPLSKDILPYSKILPIHPSISFETNPHSSILSPKICSNKMVFFHFPPLPPNRWHLPTPTAKQTTVGNPRVRSSGPASSWNSSTTSFGAQITRLASSGDTCNSLKAEGRSRSAPRMPNNHGILRGAGCWLKTKNPWKIHGSLAENCYLLP